MPASPAADDEAAAAVPKGESEAPPLLPPAKPAGPPLAKTAPPPAPEGMPGQDLPSEGLPDRGPLQASADLAKAKVPPRGKSAAPKQAQIASCFQKAKAATSGQS